VDGRADVGVSGDSVCGGVLWRDPTLAIVSVFLRVWCQ
jgi:hypothetical protein